MEQTVQLQVIGHVRAKAAKDFKVGEYSVWNYGGTSKILCPKIQTKTQLVFITETPDGRKWERRLKKERLVGIGEELSFRLDKGEIDIHEYASLRKQAKEVEA